MTTGKSIQPAHVRMYVMSDAQTWSEPVGAKSRSSRFGAIGSPWRESVVARKGRGRQPRKPSSLINLATRFRPT